MPIISAFPGGGGNGSGGGLALAAVTNITTQVASEKVYVKWTDPDDLVVGDATLATWAGTLLVRKAGSMPASRRDGNVVVDSKERNAYKDSYFEDTGLANGTIYYYKFFPYTTASTYTDDPRDEFTETPNPVAPGNVSGMSAVPGGNGKLAIKWTDPEQTVVVDGVTLATWEKTIVVVKKDGYATTPDDENADYKETVMTRNQHITDPLIATGLENGITYYVSFFPVSTDGGININEANRTTGEANRMTLTGIPAQSNTLTYNGGEQNPAWNANYDSAKMLLGGETVGRDAGNYTATFTPYEDYMWPGGSTDVQNVQWVIGQAVGTLTVSTNTVSLDKTTTSTTFTIGGNHDGTVTATSSDTSVATVSLNAEKTVATVSSVNSTTGSATITVSCTAGKNYTKPADQKVTVNAKFVTIYGVQWAGTSATTLTRTDASASFKDPTPAVSNGTGSSPFDDLLPWSGMEKTTDSQAGTIVAIPKFWYKIDQSGTTLNIRIADGEVDGYSVSPAHMNRGDGKVRDTVYVGRYHCASDYKSTTGVQPVTNMTCGNAYTSVHNLGSTIWQMDFAMRFTLWLLYIVEFANWDSQATIGRGCSPGNAKYNMGATDAMKYHTGTDQANRTTYGSTQYRNIEGLWDNVYDWLGGCYYNGNGLNIVLNPATAINYSSPSGGSLVGKPSSGYPSALAISSSGGFPMFYPTTASGSDSTYIPDYWHYNASYPCLFVGGNYGQNLNHGLFYVNYNTATNTNANIGCRFLAAFS